MRMSWARRALLLLCTSTLAGIPARATPIARPLAGHDEVTLRSLAGRVTPGEQLWARRFTSPDTRADAVLDVATSPDGTKVFVTGYVHVAGGTTDYATVAYDAPTGAQLWAERYDGPINGVDGAFAVGVSPDGATVFVTGLSYGVSSGDDYATVAYDASTGAQLWVSRYDGPANAIDDAYALGVSPDGAKVFVTGWSDGVTSSFDYATVAYDASTGGELWVSRYNGPGNSSDEAYSLAVSPDSSRVLVTGWSIGSGTGTDYATAAYDAATGSQQWARRYNSPRDENDMATAVGISPDATKVFVTGESAGSSGYPDYLTIAYRTSTGRQLWVHRYNGPADGTDHASALGVSPDGSMVFVTGWSYGGATDLDYATIAYQASGGATAWVRRYNGTGDFYDDARDLGVSPDGTVFVTGLSVGPTSGEDFATIAYRASTGATV